MWNGHRTGEEESMITVTEEQYLPKALMDALNGVIRRGLLCTNHEDAKTQSPPSAQRTVAPQIPSIQVCL